MLPHVFRTVLMYITVFVVMRIMGKREVGKLSIFDLVISIMIADIAVFALEDVKKPLYEGIVPMATLVLIQIGMAMLSLRFRKLRLWLDGKPSVIIHNGKINREEMRKQRYNLDDLLMQLRAKKVDSVADVEFAVLETSGQLSVFPKDKSGNADNSGGRKNKESASIVSKIKYEELPLPLIMDGKVNEENLQKIGKTRFWLKNQIQSKGLSDFKLVFFCSIDHNGKLYINPMDET
ncbi:DUF421 domain-containing protein [Paenibacillus oralis]|uniref:DUF421 domain-containing protein n=1 Tax=Paenibacillus oralis TaxID=2490856 RepID=A0A3P3UE67_9BACL|nr:DUF421 domain-containing protein [Paenibacillus oralis]RRJ67896.1 DUF421 domain-containing protein [Paenibacillus oralis]